MKSLGELYLNNATTIKELPNRIGNLESVWCLNLSYCSKFKNFPDHNRGNMKSLKEIHLNNTAVKEFSNNIANVESLEILDLSNCPKLKKF
ncbi:hypothetical protein PVL29_025065 [Vitis rotundifolia]|uniref:Uncharacterized protein n=1 Tax=Vitis rotundifolia TaxID=103349 RepID=A0AA39DAJ9_VITRO|nr:hypothetical protein PVL29_025065 [Vitis rotundifolia]